MSPSAFEDDGDAIIEMDILPPRWADVSDEVTELLASIAPQAQKLEGLHRKHVLPGFDDEVEKKGEEREIERLTGSVTRGFHECQEAIKRVDGMVREAKEAGTITRAEETMARNIQRSLASRVQEASAEFRKKQSAYLKSESLPSIFLLVVSWDKSNHFMQNFVVSLVWAQKQPAHPHPPTPTHTPPTPPSSTQKPMLHTPNPHFKHKHISPVTTPQSCNEKERSMILRPVY